MIEPERSMKPWIRRVETEDEQGMIHETVELIPIPEFKPVVSRVGRNRRITVAENDALKEFFARRTGNG